MNHIANVLHTVIFDVVVFLREAIPINIKSQQTVNIGGKLESNILIP